MVGSVFIPQHTGKIIVSRRVGCSNGVGEGLVRTLKGELDGLSVIVNLIIVEVAGNVGEPVWQCLRDSPEPPVAGSRDRHLHRPARGHRRRIEGPCGAGVLLRVHKAEAQHAYQCHGDHCYRQNLFVNQSFFIQGHTLQLSLFAPAFTTAGANRDHFLLYCPSQRLLD